MINNELIERYYSGSLSKKELLEFENLYKSNPEFKKEVDFYKNIATVSAIIDAEQFKTTLQSFEVEISKKNNFVLTKQLKPLMAIAAVFIIGFCTFFFWPAKTDEATLFNTYFQPSKNVSMPIVRSNNDHNTTTDAFIAYTQKEYKKAIVLFEKAHASDKKSEILFYEANALLASGHTEQAIEKLKEHLSFNDSLSNRSHWYLALAYIKNKNIELAKEELKTFIKSGEDFNRTEAISLLKKLE